MTTAAAKSKLSDRERALLDVAKFLLARAEREAAKVQKTAVGKEKGAGQ